MKRYHEEVAACAVDGVFKRLDDLGDEICRYERRHAQGEEGGQEGPETGEQHGEGLRVDRVTSAGGLAYLKAVLGVGRHVKMINPHLGYIEMNSGKSIEVAMVLALPAEKRARVVKARFRSVPRS